MGRRILNRKELRDNFDAAERRKPGEEEEVADEEVEGDEDEDEDEEADDKGEEEEDGEAVEAVEVGEGEDDEDEDGEPVPKKKKKAAKVVKPKVAKPKSRSRAAKVVRLRLVWGVFNNSHQCVASYDYPKRKDAEAHAAKLMADKKTTHFVQPVKEPIKEKEKE